MPTTRKNKDSNPNCKVCNICFELEGNSGAPKLSACSRCGLVVYCSTDCQRAHWKGSHKQHCIAKAHRAPKHRNILECHEYECGGAIAGEKCAICQDMLCEASCTLPCAHVFHSTCVAELRKLGVQQVCSLCRVPLPEGPEELADQANRRFMIVRQLTRRLRDGSKRQRHKGMY